MWNVVASYSGKKKKWFLRWWFILPALGLIAGGAVFAYNRANKPQYVLITAVRGTVTQEVSVTGQVTPAEDLSLAFEGTGKVAKVYHDVGERVVAGEPIVALNSSDLSAQLASAQANVDAAAAKLADLQNSPRPEEVAVKQTILGQANLTLQNAYAGVFTTLQSAYTSSDDAVRKQAGIFFIGGDQASPVLSFQTTDNQAQIDSQSKRANLTVELNSWNSELVTLGPQSAQSNLDAELARAVTYLTDVQSFLKRLGDALLAQSNIPAANLSTYQANLTAARTEITTALSNVTTVQQTLAADNLAVQKAAADLALTKAGATPEAIRGQQAQVDAAKANVADIQAQISKTVILAPITGVITEQNAKVGEIASPQVTLVKMISDGKFEITSQVPETDVSHVQTSKPVRITFDALPGENFTGTVVSVDPGETILEGVATYKTTVSIDSPDARIKPGMTANMDILVDRHDNTLWVPQRVVVSEDSGKYVTVLNKDGTQEKREVKTGLRGQEGQIEIVSGLEEGEQVLRSAQ